MAEPFCREEMCIRDRNSPAPALRDVALTVQPGECVLLCGRSGCGKTTFSRLLNSLAPVFYPGALAGQCTAAGLAAGEAAIEDYVPKVGSVFQMCIRDRVWRATRTATPSTPTAM